MESFFYHDAFHPDDSRSPEWLLSNSLGDYASGTVNGCGSRRYHGLLAAQTREGRCMLLSAVEDCVSIDGETFPLSTRHHPGVTWPEGWKLNTSLACSETEISRAFRLRPRSGGAVLLRRTVRLCSDTTRVILRYELQGDVGTAFSGNAELIVKPLLSCRSADHLQHAGPDHSFDLTASGPGIGSAGFSCKRAGTPPIFMEMRCQDRNGCQFAAAPDWYYNILYPTEHSRGYDWSEDLFMPGTFRTSISAGQSAWLIAGTSPSSASPEELWRAVPECSAPYREPVLDHLYRECGRFLITIQSEQLVPAGYHWFGPWGRDTLIALPGLTFLAGRLPEGKAILSQISRSVRSGLVPNLLGSGNGTASYNSADASLWYILAVHRLYEACPGELPFIRDECWPVMKSIIRHYARGTMPDGQGGMLIKADGEGLLHVGNEHTQLTWMDAAVRGVPVTPRHGCPIELNALWYDALSFVRELAGRFAEQPPEETGLLALLAPAFRRVFLPSGNDVALMRGGLYDAWSPSDGPSRHIRPNQVIAAAMPFTPLTDDERRSVINCAREELLTPYGLRTLSPSDAGYQPVCCGNQAERDQAYHQGTVWPWLLGFYGEAVLRCDPACDLSGFLQTVTPLFTDHFAQAGLGCISEIFDGDPPHSPGGCIAQAWSTAEALRLLLLIREKQPSVWKQWAEG